MDAHTAPRSHAFDWTDCVVKRDVGTYAEDDFGSIELCVEYKTRSPDYESHHEAGPVISVLYWKPGAEKGKDDFGLAFVSLRSMIWRVNRAAEMLDVEGNNDDGNDAESIMGVVGQLRDLARAFESLANKGRASPAVARTSAWCTSV